MHGWCIPRLMQPPGTLTYADGSKYTGDWHEHVRCGMGEFVDAQGNTFVGEWEDDVRSGRGSIKMANGDVWMGSWAHDRRLNGVATCVYASGDNFTGDWRDGVRCGEGICIFRSAVRGVRLGVGWWLTVGKRFGGAFAATDASAASLCSNPLWCTADGVG